MQTLERRCIVERSSKPKDQLIRFVLGPDNQVYPDLKHKLPGRGVWVSANRKLVEQALEKNLFARGFKARCTVSKDLAQTIDDQLEATCLGLLSMAKKAGQIVTGFDKVASRIKAGEVEILIAASDAADDGREKLERSYIKASNGGPVINLFSSGQMNLVLGGANVIHAAITRGTMAKNILAAADKLALYRG